MRMLLILTLLLAFPIALAANGDDQCRNMNGHGVYGDDYFQAPCEFDGTDYGYCFVSKMRGTINGTMVEYFQDDWVILLESLEIIPKNPHFIDAISTPPDAGDAGGSWYNREFAVLTSKQGMIWGEAQYVADVRLYDMGGFAIPMTVTGGTGIYEEAYGWVTWTFTDSTLSKFSYDGRVCGPYIPND